MSVTLQLPNDLGLTERELKLLLAVKLFESGKLTLGQAAHVAELSRPAFAEMLGFYGVSLFNYDPEEIAQDVRNA